MGLDLFSIRFFHEIENNNAVPAFKMGNIFSISDFCWIVKHFLDTFDRCEKMQKICFFLSIKSEKKRKKEEKDKKNGKR